MPFAYQAILNMHPIARRIRQSNSADADKCIYLRIGMPVFFDDGLCGREGAGETRGPCACAEPPVAQASRLFPSRRGSGPMP